MAVPRVLQPFVDEPGAGRAVRRLRRLAVADRARPGVGAAAARGVRGAGATRPAARACRGRERSSGGVPRATRSAIDGLDYAGTYGLERIVAGDVVLDERVRPFLDAIVQAADEAEAALPGLHVERKGQVAVTIHWRDQPERGDAATRWAAEAAPRLGLDAPLRGRMAVELRPPVPVDKGTTVAELSLGLHAAAFAGDDAGDLPAFAALHALVADGALAHAVSIGVTSDESPPEVRARRRRGRGAGGIGGTARRARRRDRWLDDRLDYRAWLSNSSSQVRGVWAAASSHRVFARAARSSLGIVERAVQRVCALFDVVRVHRDHRVVQLLVRTGFGREAQHPVAPVHQRPFLGDEVEAVLDRVHEQHVVALQRRRWIARSRRACRATTGCQSRVAQRSFTRAAAWSTSLRVREVLGQALARRVEHARRTPRARAHSACGLEERGRTRGSRARCSSTVDAVAAQRSACGRRPASSSSAAAACRAVARRELGEGVGIGSEAGGERTARSTLAAEHLARRCR